MAAKKNPTLSDVYKKLDNMDTRLTNLETWKIADDAGKAAVTAYRQEETRKSWSQILKDLIPLIAAVTLLAYAAANHIGIK